MTPSPTVTKPSTTWVKCDVHGHWHYICDQTCGDSFCGNSASVQTAIHSSTSWPKKKECCAACYAEATRLQKLWTTRKQQSVPQSLVNTLSKLHHQAISSSYQPPDTISNAEEFVGALKALANLGHCCNALLEQKRLSQIDMVCGRMKVSPAIIQHWKRTCTNAFDTYPEVANFWPPVLARFSRPGEPCTYSDIANHVVAVSDAYNKFHAEELTEAKNDRLAKQHQQSRAKKGTKSARRQTFASSKMKPTAPPAKNSASGVPGNPTYRRW